MAPTANRSGRNRGSREYHPVKGALLAPGSSCPSPHLRPGLRAIRVSRRCLVWCRTARRPVHWTNPEGEIVACAMPGHPELRGHQRKCDVGRRPPFTDAGVPCPPAPTKKATKKASTRPRQELASRPPSPPTPVPLRCAHRRWRQALSAIRASPRARPKPMPTKNSAVSMPHGTGSGTLRPLVHASGERPCKRPGLSRPSSTKPSSMPPLYSG